MPCTAALEALGDPNGVPEGEKDNTLVGEFVPRACDAFSGPACCCVARRKSTHSSSCHASVGVLASCSLLGDPQKRALSATASRAQSPGMASTRVSAAASGVDDRLCVLLPQKSVAPMLCPTGSRGVSIAALRPKTLVFVLLEGLLDEADGGESVVSSLWRELCRKMTKANKSPSRIAMSDRHPVRFFCRLNG